MLQGLILIDALVFCLLEEERKEKKREREREVAGWLLSQAQRPDTPCWLCQMVSQVLGKRHTSHTKEAHKRYLMSKSLISRLAGQEKMAQQLLLVGLALSSIWEKARARNRQREVAGDKGQWGFVLQGMRPAVAQAAEW
jgi:hypothetical protein